MYRSLLPALLLASPAFAEVPKVVTDIAPVQGLVASVMGDLGTPDLLIPASASPHSHALKPSEARALQQADLVFWIGEELGLVGVLGMLTLYLILVARGLHIATQGAHTFERLLAGSLTLTFFVYVFVNVAMVSGLLRFSGASRVHSAGTPKPATTKSAKIATGITISGLAKPSPRTPMMAR